MRNEMELPIRAEDLWEHKIKELKQQLEREDGRIASTRSYLEALLDARNHAVTLSKRFGVVELGDDQLDGLHRAVVIEKNRREQEKDERQES